MNISTNLSCYLPGKRFFPPDFCQSENERDLKVVIPLAPRFFPFGPFSWAFIFFHCSFDMPLGMYSIVIPLLFRAGVDTEDPENEDDVEKADTCDTARRSVMELAKKDFIVVICLCSGCIL